MPTRCERRLRDAMVIASLVRKGAGAELRRRGDALPAAVAVWMAHGYVRRGRWVVTSGASRRCLGEGATFLSPAANGPGAGHGCTQAVSLEAPHGQGVGMLPPTGVQGLRRSEEHTSELQSLRQ